MVELPSPEDVKALTPSACCCEIFGNKIFEDYKANTVVGFL